MKDHGRTAIVITSILAAMFITLNMQCQRTVQECIKAGQPAVECRKISGGR